MSAPARWASAAAPQAADRTCRVISRNSARGSRARGSQSLRSMEAGLLEAVESSPGEWTDEALVARLEVGGSMQRREAAREVLRRLRRGRASPPPPSLRCSADAWEQLGRRLGRRRREEFFVVALDARNRVRSVHRVAVGTLTTCMVHPREVFSPLLRRGAAAALVVHNHPSGDPTPSPEDEALTERLAEAGRLLGIPILDHLIVARDAYVSLRDRGKVGSGGGVGAGPQDVGH